MKNRAKWNNTNGFSLLEMMVTVVVIVVLCALAMIPISKMQKDIRQTELDSRAEMIFTAVQNRMTRLQAAGQSDVYTSGRDVKQMDAPPSDAERTLVYVTSGSKEEDGSAASWLYPRRRPRRSCGTLTGWWSMTPRAAACTPCFTAGRT